ncbi:MAG TPA: cytochrome P450 [Kofleriaceae bacterium]
MSVKYDLGSPSHFDDPHETFARMRRDDPVYLDPVTGYRYVTRYADVLAILRDRRWSSRRAAQYVTGTSPERAEQGRLASGFLDSWLIFLDPPDHTRLRKLVTRAFSARAVAALEAYAQEVVDTALDRMAGAGEVDLLAEFAHPVPAQVIAHMLGVAQDHIAQFKAWVADLLRLLGQVGDTDDNVAAAHRGVRGLAGYFREIIAERRKVRVDDLLGELIDADEDGRLGEQELVSTCALLLSAGHETTTNLIGNGMLALLRHPAELARLRGDPGLIPSAIEEFLRYDGAAIGLGRIALEDVEVAGQVVRAGQTVCVSPLAANRDPAVFDDPDRLDIGRRDNPHIGFGQGIHFCIGAGLARMQARVAVGSLLARFPHLALATDKPAWNGSRISRGLVRLPVSVHG